MTALVDGTGTDPGDYPTPDRSLVSEIVAEVRRRLADVPDKSTM